MNNPLLKEFTGPFGSAPFTAIQNDHFIPAFKSCIEDAKKTVDQIVKNPDDASFENTLVPLEFSGNQLNRVSSIFFNLNAAETDEEIQKIAQKVSPLLSEFANDISLNEALFKRIKSVYAKKDSLNLNPEQQMLLEKNYKAFVRNGANLNDEDKKKLREIDKKKSKLGLKFGENVLAETNKFELIILNEEDLSGLPDGVMEAAKMRAKEKNKKGWLFTLDYPSYIPFMTYADNRALREKLSRAFGSRGFQKNEYNNEKIVKEIVSLRHDRAKLLGYESHAHYVLEERMAETPEKVKIFLSELLSKAKPAAEKEFELIRGLAVEDGIENLEKWDGAYYSERLKKLKFNLDDEKLKPYFKLENVIKGVFEIANRLYDLNFKPASNVDTYHKEVKTYEVTDSSGEFVALFYADFFPRKGKRNGAWMTSYKPQWKEGESNSRPHISIVCNFTRPTETKPSLLTFNEVTTLFHEFGHALHGMLANTTYPNLSGTSVYWDFVELPSQILENWCFEKEALVMFAKHYESDEPIPMELVQKIKESSNFLEGIATLRQLSFGMLDMAYHSEDPVQIKNLKEFELKAFGSTQLYPDVEENCMSTAFSHIFQGGYSAGYYSYKWAEVLDADAFEAFKEQGIFNKSVAAKFKENILSKGGTEKPMVLYKRFRGKEPSPEALLKRAGLLESK
ncbi:M3 family metallopeptidase [Lutimonas zeaxanthinifaciens]|uniref:M3 family metallopeptidase n=1 Tax=Lutimonas zeaxanthinifaciens TaxID=3060215 RepID=UPI00265D29D4|nr:M3 family metallopeptidase [Lutimonas sp. YSD2104]WKK65509.1 M3 family metallopeptidase [Lutimonas sp. YSD2104]